MNFTLLHPKEVIHRVLSKLKIVQLHPFDDFKWNDPYIIFLKSTVLEIISIEAALIAHPVCISKVWHESVICYFIKISEISPLTVCYDTYIIEWTYIIQNDVKTRKEVCKSINNS